MTSTPNPTAESVIAEAMVNAGAPLMHSRVEESVAAALRAHGLLSEGAPTETKWVCGKCSREQARGHDDGQIPEHHRTCQKRTEAKQPEDWSTEELDKVTLDSLTVRKSAPVNAFCIEHGNFHAVELGDPTCEFEDGLGEPVEGEKP